MPSMPTIDELADNWSQMDIYRQFRAVILRKMDSGKIEPKTALRLIKEIKDSIKKIASIADLEIFLKFVPEKYPELEGVEKVFTNKSLEKTDELIANLWEELIGKIDMSAMDRLMSKALELKNRNETESFLHEMERTYPEEMSVARKKTR